MSKYDFELDLSGDTSTGILLGQIPKGATVLEFGCAAGRMTRYMKEILHCRVYIVEYDREACARAAVYAEDAVCDDILTYSWAERFGDIRFDAILFADVLEHLSEPEKVLEAAGRLLKDTGRMYLSVPNITHNDILLKALEERFDYTATGLLDDTHIHFWGLENIKTLSRGTRLHLHRVQATYCPTGYTEQFPDGAPEVELLLRNRLMQRTGGEVYQFVVTLGLFPVPQVEYDLKKPGITSHIYLDTGRDFNPEERIALVSSLGETGTYRTSWVLEDPAQLRRIRFDPVESQGCVLTHLSIRQGQELEIVAPGGVQLSAGLLLPGEDPMVIADTVNNGQPVILEAEFLLPGEAYLRRLTEAAVESGQLRRERIQLREVNQDLSAQHQALCTQHQELGAVHRDLSAQHQALCEAHQELGRQHHQLCLEHINLHEQYRLQQEHNSQLDKALAEQTRQNRELRQDLGAYQILVNSKELRMLDLQRQLDALREKEVQWEREKAIAAQRDFFQDVKYVLKRHIRKGEPHD